MPGLTQGDVTLRIQREMAPLIKYFAEKWLFLLKRWYFTLDGGMVDINLTQEEFLEVLICIFHGHKFCQNCRDCPNFINVCCEGLSNSVAVSSAPAKANSSLLIPPLCTPPKQPLSQLPLEIFSGKVFIWNLPTTTSSS